MLSAQMWGAFSVAHRSYLLPQLWTFENPGPASTAARHVLSERDHGCCFVFFHIEQGEELRDVQQIVNPFGRVQQLQFSAVLLRRGIGFNEFTDARAVNVVYVPEVEQDLLIPLRKQIAH